MSPGWRYAVHHLLAPTAVGALFGVLGSQIVAFESEQSVKESCSDTAQLLAAFESVERGDPVLQTEHSHNGVCWIYVRYMFSEKPPKVYTLASAQQRIDALIKKHGVLK